MSHSRNIFYVEHVAGIAGDMFAAACLDTDIVTAQELQSLPEKLGFVNVEIQISKKNTANISATHIDVIYDESSWADLLKAGAHEHSVNHEHGHHHEHSHSEDHSHDHIHYSFIRQLIKDAQLDEEAKKFALKAYRHLAEAEASVHGIDVEHVAFHEVGKIDSIMDVVMAGFCYSKIKPDAVWSSQVKLGRGTIKIQHGTYPVPPPASALLSEGIPVATIPAAITMENVELSTPTGLSILKALEPQFMNEWPQGRVLKQGTGAGTRDMGSYPNILRVVLIESTQQPSAALPYKQGNAVEIICNLDDQTPEKTAWAQQQLLNMGAWDAWVTPVTTKKNRVGVILTVLSAPENLPEYADWILRNTSTFGLRYYYLNKLELEREMEERQTSGGIVRYKIGYTTDGEKLKEKPEFDDLADHGFPDQHS